MERKDARAIACELLTKSANEHDGSMYSWLEREVEKIIEAKTDILLAQNAAKKPGRRSWGAE